MKNEARGPPLCHELVPILPPSESAAYKKGVAFTEVDIEASAENRKAMIDVSGRRTVPQIFINGTHVGGSDELHALDARGGLDQLLAIGRPPVT